MLELILKCCLVTKMHLYSLWRSIILKPRLVCSQEWFYQQCCTKLLGRAMNLYSKMLNDNIQISKAQPKFQHVISSGTQNDLNSQERKPTHFQALTMYLWNHIFLGKLLKDLSFQIGRLAHQSPKQERLTYHTFGKRSSFQGCQTKISNLDWSSRASNEDVVTF